MKTMLILLLFCASCAWGQPTRQVQLKALNVTVSEKKGGPRVQGTTIPEMIALNLFGKPGIDISVVPALSGKSDYTVEGDASFYNESFFINLRVNSNRTTKQYSLPCTGKYAEFTSRVNSLSNELVKTILEETEVEKKVIGIRVVNDPNSKARHVPTDVTTVILKSLISKVNDNMTVRVQLIDDAGAPGETMKRKKLNGVIDALFSYEPDKSILVQSNLHIEALNEGLTLRPTIISDRVKYSDLENAVKQDFIGLFEFLVTQGGQWNKTNTEILADISKTNPDSLLARAWTYYNNKNYFPAVFCSNRYISSKPRSPTGHYVLANVRIVQNRALEALFELDEILRIDDKRPEVHYVKGRILYNQGDYKNALLSYKASEKLNPGYVHTDTASLSVQLGRTYMMLDSTRLAIQYLNKATSRNPAEWDAYFYLGNCYLDLEQYPQSIVELRKYLGRYPEDKNAKLSLRRNYINIGQAAEEKGNYDSAYRSFVTGLSIYEDEYINQECIDALNRGGRAKSADSLFSLKEKKQMLGSNPYFWYAEDLRSIYFGQSFNRNKNLMVRAANYMHKHLADNKNDTMAIWVLGNTYLNFDLRKGIRYLEQVHAMVPERVDIILDLGEGYLMTGRFQDVELIIPDKLLDSLEGKARPGERSDFVIALYLRLAACMSQQGTNTPCNQEKLASRFDLALKEKGLSLGWDFYAYEEVLGKYSGSSKDKLLRMVGRLKTFK